MFATVPLQSRSQPPKNGIGMPMNFYDSRLLRPSFSKATLVRDSTPGEIPIGSIALRPARSPVACCWRSAMRKLLAGEAQATLR